MEIHPVGFQFPFQVEDRFSSPDLEVIPDHASGRNGPQALDPTLDLYLVMASQDFKKGFILE